MEFTFGKYEGCPVEEVFEIDPGYIYWLMQQEWFEDQYPAEHEEIEILQSYSK